MQICYILWATPSIFITYTLQKQVCLRQHFECVAPFEKWFRVRSTFREVV